MGCDARRGERQARHEEHVRRGMGEHLRQNQDHSRTRQGDVFQARVQGLPTHFIPSFPVGSYAEIIGWVVGLAGAGITDASTPSSVDRRSSSLQGHGAYRLPVVNGVERGAGLHGRRPLECAVGLQMHLPHDRRLAGGA